MLSWTPSVQPHTANLGGRQPTQPAGLRRSPLLSGAAPGVARSAAETVASRAAPGSLFTSTRVRAHGWRGYSAGVATVSPLLAVVAQWSGMKYDISTRTRRKETRGARAGPPASGPGLNKCSARALLRACLVLPLEKGHHTHNYATP
eukprot:scaffold16237_cov72-Phaeocystis_antarctica.AAC.3